MDSCKNKEAEKSAAECKIASDDLNPNGDSELAILMRAMTVATEKNTALLREKKETENYSDTLSTILTAKPSDLGLDKDIFDGFDYQPKLKVNISDFQQSFTPFFTGNLNFIAS
ncbi:MAG: hypothetical protein EAZ32_16955, partial [Cytophagia bacterium]